MLPPAIHSSPFNIAAFGRDEAGRVYVANYGAPYYIQVPPEFDSVEKWTGGGIYRIDDDPLQFTATTVTNRNRLTLEWQSIPGLTYKSKHLSTRIAGSWFEL